MASKWKEVKFGEVFHVKHGYAFKGEFFTEAPQEFILATPGNFAIGGGFQMGKAKYYSGEVPEGYILQPGQVIVTMTDLSKASDTLGFFAIVPNDGKKWLHNQRVGLLEFQDKTAFCPQFFNYLSRSNEYRSWIIGSASGTTVKHTSPNRIEAFSCLVPSVAVQRSIAHILATLDDKIELLRSMNETLESMARALFKSWFIDFDPVRKKAEGLPTGLPPEIDSLFPDSFEDSELGEIPKGWRIKELTEDFEITMGQSPPGESYNEIGAGIPFYQGRTDFGFRFPTRRLFCTEPKRFADADDTLVSVRAPVGDMNRAYEKCCIGRGVASVHHRKGYRTFTYYHLDSIKGSFLKFEAEGTVFGSINQKDFQQISSISPPEKVISLFDKQMSPFDFQIRRQSEELDLVRKTRDSLLPKLISGELELSDKAITKILEPAK
jgi:type I restriction enzyme, S subunit